MKECFAKTLQYIAIQSQMLKKIQIYVFVRHIHMSICLHMQVVKFIKFFCDYIVKYV